MIFYRAFSGYASRIQTTAQVMRMYIHAHGVQVQPASL